MEGTALNTDVNSLLVSLEQLAGRFKDALHARILSWSDAPEQYGELGTTLAAASTTSFWLGLQIIVVVSIVAGTLLLVGRQISAMSGAGSAWRRFFTVLGGAVVALIVGLTVAQLLATTDMTVRILRLWASTPVAAWVLLVALRGLLLTSPPGELRHRPSRRAKLVRDLSFAILWAVAGLTLVATLRLLSAGPGLTDLVGTGLVALPSLVLFVAAILRNRKTVAGAVAGPQPRGPWRARFARAWPAIVSVFIILIVANMQAARTLGAGLPGGVVLMTALIVMATPHLDAIIWSWAKAGLDSPKISTASAAWRQTARFTVLIAVLALLGMLWATPLAVGLGIDLQLVAYDAVKVALISCMAAFLWNLIATATARIAQQDQGLALEQVAGDGPRSRLGTLVPLLGAVGKSFIVAVGFLSILVTIGVNVWPLITGLSFFGLAISFGTQALVKDVVSGLFTSSTTPFATVSTSRHPGPRVPWKNFHSLCHAAWFARAYCDRALRPDGKDPEFQPGLGQGKNRFPPCLRHRH